MTKPLFHLFCFAFLFVATCPEVSGQDIEQVTKAKPVTVSGGFGLSSNYYAANGIENRRAPFFWTANANLNFNFFGLISAPFSMQFSPQGNQFNYPYQQLQPFNKMGISPKYKAVTVHLGYRSLNFSTYTYGGASFSGVGIEVNPEKSKFYASALYGRLAKAVQEGVNNNSLGVTLYDRWSYGTKMGMKTKAGKVELIAFKAWDNESSLILTDRLEESPPAENMVVGINSDFSIRKKINIKVEYALSAYTTNALAESALPINGFYNALSGVYRPNNSSKYNSAINTSINYNHSKFTTGLTYKRIDPEYETMGIPFLNNDAEDITANIAFRLFKNKMNISTNGGLQRNNLDNTLASKTLRVIGGANLSYAPSNKLNFTVGFANFSTSTLRTRILELDSLEYYQVTTSANFSSGYRFGKEKAPQSIMLGANYQIADDAQDNASEVYSANLNYGYSIPSISLTASAGINGNVNSFQGTENVGWGPMMSLSRPFFEKKVKCSVNGAMLTYQNGSIISNRTYNAGANLSYTLKEKHSFGLTYNFIFRKDFVGTQSFEENRAGLKYNYRF